jgi:hypothetical protein
MFDATGKGRALKKRAIAVAIATLMGSSAITLLAASPASAEPSYFTDAGSATTYNMEVALFGGTQTDGTVVAPAGTTPVLNSIQPGQTTNPVVVGSTDYGIPPGTDCTPGVIFGSAADNWGDGSASGYQSSSSGNPAPNGSSEGKDALYDQDQFATSLTGFSACYDIARSSSAPSNPVAAPDDANFQYYAYALDAVTFLVGSDATTGAGLAPGTPAELTLQEVYYIYDCTYTNWDQVVVGYTPSGLPIKGANAPIYRFWPQKGSGTLAMAQNMLSSVALSKDNPNAKGFDPTVAAYSPDGTAAGDSPSGGNNACVNGLYNYGGNFISEENSETVIAQSTAAEDAGAIFPYSAGQFVAQWNNNSDYNSFGAANGGPNFDPSLSLASLGDLGTLSSTDALPYQYGDTTDSPTGSANYPFAPYLTHSFTTNANLGNPLVGSTNAVEQINQTVVNETNEWYEGYGVVPDIVPGIRYLYNVVDSANPDYGTALGLIGFNNTAAVEGGQATGFVSNLCKDIDIGSGSTGTPASIIAASGFVPLGTLGGPAGSNTVASHCRELIP